MRFLDTGTVNNHFEAAYFTEVLQKVKKMQLFSVGPIFSLVPVCLANGSVEWNECPDHEWNLVFVGAGRLVNHFSKFDCTAWFCLVMSLIGRVSVAPSFELPKNSGLV